MGTGLAALAALALLTPPADLRAQGAGAAGAQVLQLNAGSRAAAFSGAYAAAGGDADVIFYNPAGVASFGRAAALSYQRYVEDISLGSVSGGVRLGRVTLGAGAVFLDAGDIQVVEPDPDFPGQRGRPTDLTAGASETAARLAVALPLLDERLLVGAGVGMVSTSIAGSSQAAALFDAGAQFRVRRLTLGAAVRNLGSSLSGGDLAEAKLPTEAALGANVDFTRAGGMGAALAADAIYRIREETTAFAGGVEAGLYPTGTSRLGAVARAGYQTEDDGGLGTFRLGAGLSLGDLAVDYTFQDLEFFGAVHRIGVRWLRSAP